MEVRRRVKLEGPELEEYQKSLRDKLEETTKYDEALIVMVSQILLFFVIVGVQ